MLFRSDDVFEEDGDGEKGNDGMEIVAGKDHLDLLKSQAPLVMQELQGEISDGGNDFNNEESKKEFANPSSSLLFRDQLLTKEALDDMCCCDSGNFLEKTFTIGKSSKPVRPEARQFAFVDDDSKDDTSFGTSFSQDSCDAPSIAPGVLVSKMASMFLDNHDPLAAVSPETTTTVAANKEEHGSYQQAYRLVENCKRVNPKEFQFMQMKFESSPSPTSTRTNYKSKTFKDTAGPKPFNGEIGRAHV